ncbi:MAG: phosphotransferase, partial [Ruminococcus sp.]|nr:phosphotransferase [Ruminococcus sp.]
GINTAIPYGIVRVGDGYGTVTELLNAESVTKIIRKNPDNLTEAVNYFVDMLKSIHAIVVDDNVVPDMKETAIRWAEFVSEHLPEESGKKLVALINSLPKRNTLLHGDYHSSNIMVQNGEPLLIDMDTLCMGHPVFELASMFNAYVGFGEFAPEEITNFFDISIETANRFWDMSLKKYLDTDDEAQCRNVARKAEVIGYLRLLRRAIRRPDDPSSCAKISIYKEKIVNALNVVDTLDF